MKTVDSVGWIEYFAGGPLAGQYREHLLDSASIVTPAVVLYEVFKHVLRNIGKEAALQAAAQIMKTRVVPLDAATAVYAAEVSITHGLPMADAMVYATALAADAQVITSDAHFADLPGVIFLARKKP